MHFIIFELCDMETAFTRVPFAMQFKGLSTFPACLLRLQDVGCWLLAAGSTASESCITAVANFLFWPVP